MKLTQKHFEFIAQALNSTKPLYPRTVGESVVWYTVVERFADTLAHTNPKFKRSLFLSDCGAEELAPRGAEIVDPTQG